MKTDTEIYYDKLEKESNLRDQFAMAAMQGLVAKGAALVKADDFIYVATDAYEMADAMLKVRNDR